MVFISKLLSGRNLYSLFTYKPYDDNRFFNKIDSLICKEDELSDNFIRIVEEIINLYKDDLVFNLEAKRNYDYICPVISNEKFYNLNLMICNFISKEFNVPVVNDFFNETNIDKLDYKDKYTKDDAINFSINEKYLNNDILFVDVLSSTGSVLDYIASKFNKKSIVDFVTIGVRFNAPSINNSKIQNIEELSFDLECLYSDGYVVEIKGLFNKKDVVVDLRRNLSIIIGANGDGKSTAYKIATLATSNYVGDVLRLSKYYFNAIHINKYVDNELVDTKIIEYKDVIPSKKRLTKLFNTKKSKNEKISNIKKTLKKRLYTIFDKNLIDKTLNKENRKSFVKFIKCINDEEYISLFRKVIYGDKTCNNDIIRIIRKNNLEMKFNTIKDVLDLLSNNNYIKNDYSLIETNDVNYFDCTINRKIAQAIYKREMVFGEEDFDFEDYYDEEMFYAEPISYDEFSEYEENFKYEEMDEEEYRMTHIDDYSDDYYDEYDGYNGMDVEPDDRDIEDYYRRLEEYEESYYDYDDYEPAYRTKPKKPTYTVKNGLICLYKNVLVDSFVFYKDNSSFDDVINIDGLFRFNKQYLSRVYGYVNTLDYCNEIEGNINEELEKDLNNYLIENQYLIQFGLYSILNKQQFENLSNALKNKQLKNRAKFIESFKKIVEATKNTLSKKVLIVEKILNKYYVDKTVNILNNTIYILDQENNYIPINALSAGEKNLMIILLYVALNERSIIFDEPELSMNIAWQNELIKDLIKLQHPNQRFTILTQTPQLISYAELAKFISSINSAENENFSYNNSLGGSEDSMNTVDLSELEFKEYDDRLPFKMVVI